MATPCTASNPWLSARPACKALWKIARQPPKAPTLAISYFATYIDEFAPCSSKALRSELPSLADGDLTPMMHARERSRVCSSSCACVPAR